MFRGLNNCDIHVYAFEKLGVWQDAKKLVVHAYKTTTTFPSEEKFGLVNQLRRATVSIASNIAEGSARKTNKDQGHFYHIAYGSMIELLNQLIISCDLQFITTQQLAECRAEIEVLSGKLNALRRSTLNA